jgi:hypothetical protein
MRARAEAESATNVKALTRQTATRNLRMLQPFLGPLLRGTG